MDKFFATFANATSRVAGSPGAFLACVLLVRIWGAAGPAFHFSETRRLVINTGTTNITFLMVSPIQNTQNRAAIAVQAQHAAGPPLWICGECHLGNLGPIADAAGTVEVQVRDLDQTVIGNPAHDLVRLGLSLASAARGADLPGVTTARMLEEMISGYQLA